MVVVVVSVVGGVFGVVAHVAVAVAGAFAVIFGVGVFICCFKMGAMPFPCNGVLFLQANLPRVLPVLISKYANCLIPYTDAFLILYGVWPSFF